MWAIPEGLNLVPWYPQSAKPPCWSLKFWVLCVVLSHYSWRQQGQNKLCPLYQQLSNTPCTWGHLMIISNKLDIFPVPQGILPSSVERGMTIKICRMRNKQDGYARVGKTMIFFQSSIRWNLITVLWFSRHLDIQHLHFHVVGKNFSLHLLSWSLVSRAGIHTFSKYLWSCYYMPDFIPGTGRYNNKQRRQNLCPGHAYSLVGGR